MSMKRVVPAAALALAASLAACATGGGYGRGSDYVHESSYAPPTETNVVYVDEATYPTRTYFYEPRDVEHVYFYEDRRPDVVVYRNSYRDHARTYYVEYDGSVERRVYFDDRAARARRFERAEHERERLLAEARERDRDRLNDWRSRHERREHEHGAR